MLHKNSSLMSNKQQAMILQNYYYNYAKFMHNLLGW